MQHSEHAAPSAKELREAALRLADTITGKNTDVRHHEDYIPACREACAVLYALASGPTLEERLMVEEVRAEDALLAIIENAETEDDFEEEEYQDAVSWADRSSEDRADHARKLSEEAGG